MDSYRRSRRIGAAAILCALVVRLYSAGVPEKAMNSLIRPKIVSFLNKYLETGQNVRSLDFEGEKPVFSYAIESPPPAQREAPIEEETVPEETVPFLLDADSISVTYGCKLRPDLEALLEQPLSLPVSPGAPAVLILSTHSTESYTKSGEAYRESSPYRTLDSGFNMLSIDNFVAEQLEQAGISVLLDEALHDYPSYTGAYSHARKAIEQYLADYPSIRLVLDLHRDAAEGKNGQLRTHATLDGQDCAQIMLVIGTNASGLQHDHWQDNLSLGLKLHGELEALAPGITRPLNLRAQRFNQDLSPGALLIEVGAAGNTHQEAIRAAKVLAEAVVRLMG